MSLSHKHIVWAVILILFGCGQEVKIVEVDPTSLSFTKRTQSRKIEVKAKDIIDAEVPGVLFNFRSEDPSVATIDSTGVVRPVGNGSSAVLAETKEGVKGEAFVKVCLPKDLICEPAEKLTLKVGLAGPIKCYVTDCKDERISARIELTPTDNKIVLKEGNDVFIGLNVGDTKVTVKAFDIEKKVQIHVDEQIFLPGMGPDSGGGRRRGGGGGGGGGDKGGDPYGGGGRFDHILEGMKFKD